jgi:hypothetical protein
VVDAGAAENGIVDWTKTKLTISGAQAGAPNLTRTQLKIMEEEAGDRPFEIGGARGEGGKFDLDAEDQDNGGPGNGLVSDLCYFLTQSL